MKMNVEITPFSPPYFKEEIRGGGLLAFRHLELVWHLDFELWIHLGFAIS